MQARAELRLQATHNPESIEKIANDGAHVQHAVVPRNKVHGLLVAIFSAPTGRTMYITLMYCH
jgi:hypothetical protein